MDQPVDQHFPRVNASAVADIFEPAPTILIGMSVLNGSCTFPVLPDSGADISVAGLAMLECLNEHPDNLLYSSVTPRAVNGSTMSSPAQAVADIAAEEAKVFTKLDALKGYHQCPLAEASQLLTTFITPFGRFKFLRAPYGISSISEHYNHRMDEAFAGLKGHRRIVDDVVIFDRDTTLHASHVKMFLQRCVERQITLNTDKWVYARPEVDFAGFHLSGDGYSIDNSIVTAISRFPQPANRTDLRSFVGLVNQFVILYAFHRWVAGAAQTLIEH